MTEQANSRSRRRSRTPRASRGLPNPGIVVLHALIILLCLLTFFPIFWMVSTAFMTPEDIFAREVRFLPTRPTLQNFSEAFRLQPVGHWIMNSVFIAVAIVAGQLLISVLAAYAFARYRFRGRDVLFVLVVGTLIVPDVITIIPNYILVSDLDWINTPQGVIVPRTAFTGFYIFLLRQAMLSLPQELFDAARLDGAGAMTILWRIVVPLVRPALVVVVVVSFLSAWNLYLWPLLVLNDTEAQTIAVGLQYFAQTPDAGVPAWGAQMAVATMAIVPPLLLYVFLQRAILSAYVESGIKG